MQIGATSLRSDALRTSDSLASSVDALRDALAGPDALVWLRCCSAFGHHGREFARRLADRLGCRVAGHTHIIGFFQSGTHSLAPGALPAWDLAEGVRFDAGKAIGALGSSPRAPNTITCLARDLPRGI
jgi:hypothetical protein